MKPILFNTEQVRKILDGRKTQTRRPIKPQPIWIGEPNVPFKTKDADPKGIINNPYQVGDILYVGETWAILQCQYFYRADMENPTCHYKTRWRPSIHMPREAARIFLKVKDMRVERLQDMTHEDCRKEGSVPGSWLDEKVEFKLDWNAIYAKRGYSWKSNPWVWVYEFEQMKEGI